MTLDHLWITGAVYGIHALSTANSDRLTVSNSTIFGNASMGMFLEGSNDQATITGNTFYGLPGGPASGDEQYYGLYLNSADVQVSGNTLYNHGSDGILISTTGTSLVTDNHVYGNSTGISASTFSPHSLTVSGNLVHDNRQGISGSGVLVTGNTVYGHSAVESAGIRMSGGEVTQNVVHGNYQGIVTNGLVQNNRVYNNADAGIVPHGHAQIVGNSIYSNSVGVRATVSSNGFFGSITNNLIYANTNQGIVLSRSTASIVNNTIYQPVGDAVRIENFSSNVRLRNNILWVDAGYALRSSPTIARLVLIVTIIWSTLAPIQTHTSDRGPVCHEARSKTGK